MALGLSKKPPAGKFPKGTDPDVTVQQFNRGQQQLERLRPVAKREVTVYNNGILRLTQPYSRAAALREGDQFRLQQEAAIRAENVGAAPYRGFGSESLGRRRALRDVGP